jgi:malonyl-CoA decarboxylase
VQTISRPNLSTSWLERLWSSIADRGRDFANVPATSLPAGVRVRRLAEALLSGRGEASGAALARELLEALDALPPADRLAFCRHIAAGFTPDEAALREAVEAWLADPTPERAAALSNAAEPPRQELLRRMNQAQGGTAALGVAYPTGPGAARQRPTAFVCVVVQSGVSRAAPDRLEHAGGSAGEAAGL